MHDNQIEDRLRSVLRREGDDLTLNITAQELERRLALRRRARAGRRLSLIAAGIAAVAIGGIVAYSNGWLGATPAVGGKPVTSEAPVETPHQSFGPGATPLAGISPLPAAPGRTEVIRIDPAAPADRSDGTATAGANGPSLIGSMSCIGDGTLEVHFNGQSETLSCAARLSSRANIWFDVTDGLVNLTSLATGPISFAILVEQPAPGESRPVASAGACAPVDPSLSALPPAVDAGVEPGEDPPHGGVTTAYEWNGKATGIPDSWDGSVTDQIIVSPGTEVIKFVSGACLREFSAVALLTDYAEVPRPSPTPIELSVLPGPSAGAANIKPPAVGGWTVRVHATFETTDGSLAWSDSLFHVVVMFEAPTLTVSQSAGGAVAANGSCASYKLTSGASASDQCGAPYGPLVGIDPLVIAKDSSVNLALSERWRIDQVKVTAVQADLVAAGKYAPEYSVAFADKGGLNVTIPVVLDPGSWIVRVSLNGSRGGDTFGAWYDLPLQVEP